MPLVLASPWFGIALVIVSVAAAADSGFAWLERAPSDDSMARLTRSLGAGVCIGIAVWSAHGIGMSVTPMASNVAFRIESEVAVWLLASAAGAVCLGWAERRGKGSRRWLLRGCGLGLGVVAIEVVGVLAGDWNPALTWRTLPLVAACGASLVGCAGALGLLTLRIVSRHPGVRVVIRVAAASLFGLGVVGAQYGVLIGADTVPQLAAEWRTGRISLDMLRASAIFGSLASLLAMRRLLQRRVRTRKAHEKLRQDGEATAFSDRLTGLPSRQMFEGMLAQAVQRADAAGERLALLVVNLDGFKPINHAFGHLGGDTLLRQIASRVRALGNPHMTARLAGDEFLILATDDPTVKEASALAARVIAAIGQPCRIEQRDVSITCSVGVAMYPEDGAMSALMSHAQAAMAAAKGAGGAGHAFFEPRMVRGRRDEVELLRDLRVALDRGQMALFYQPKIHAPSGEITGVEALMRWHHPQRGVVSPTLFIPLAERYGLINALGRWLIDEACRQARAWRDDGLRMRVAINLSVHQLRQTDLSEQIDAALRRHQINPDLLTCEITESSAMDDSEATIRVLGELDKVGVHLAIDDFGTGHSSLSYLRKLPADELKIDRSFVLDLETSEEARKVAHAVVNLAKALGLKVVAEGVETEGQNRILREFGCDQLQGYLFAKPMSAKALAAWAMDDIGPRTMNFRASLFQEEHSAVSNLQ